MSPFWSYFWPILLGGFVAGLIGSSIAYRRRVKPIRAYSAAIAVALAFAGLWHGPIGAADRFSAQVEGMVRQSLDSWEMPQVNGHLHHGPLTRRVQLSGPADDFQRSELVRIIETVPGVSSATWTGGAGIPMIAQAALASIAGFLLGVLLAYLIELHRRHNAQWNW
jgi:hypothetical protein